MKALSKLEIA